jgi:hypothetical protein
MDTDSRISLRILDAEGKVASETYANLKNWLELSDLPLKTQVSYTASGEGEMGGVIDALSIILSSTALAQLIQCLKTWITASRPKCKFHFSDGKRVVDYEFSSVKDLDLLVKLLAIPLPEG